MAEELDRISITVPVSLLDDLNEVVAGRDYDSRSEAVREALRSLRTDYLRERDLSGTVRGAVVILYDHHDGNVPEEMTDLQHDFAETIISVQHVHLDHDLCLETLAVNGTGLDIQELSNRLHSLRGVRQVEIAVVEASS